MLRPMNTGMPRRELVFGFVAPLGVEREKVTDALRKALDDAKYILEEIHLSDALHDFADKPDVLKHVQFTLERKKVLMDAGDAMRREWAEKDETRSTRRRRRPRWNRSDSTKTARAQRRARDEA